MPLSEVDLGVLLQEARALEGIGISYLADGARSLATAPLLQAMALYQRSGSSDAQHLSRPCASWNF